MYKVFIADDNDLTVKSLCVTVPWKKWGFDLAGAEENGTDAKEWITKHHPDIAILDINMPGMNGLEVARQILNEKGETLFIFLTAYDEFSFAQEALKMQAFDYLLKPIDNDNLEAVLRRAAKKLDKQRESALYQEKMKSDFLSWTGRLLQDGINGVARSATELEEALKKEWRAVGYELMLVDTVEVLDSDMIDKLEICIKRCLMSMETSYKFRFTYVRTKPGMIILLGIKEVRILKDYALSALKIANKIVEACKTEGADVFVGISDFTEGGQTKLEKLYEEVTFAAGSRFFMENKTVVHYKSITSKSFRNEYMLSRKMQDMFHALYSEPQEFESHLNDFIELLYHENVYDADYIKNIFTQIAFTVSCSMRERESGEHSVKSMETILDDMRKIDSMQSIVVYIREYAEQAMNQFNRESSTVSSQARKAIDYINIHYMENIALKDVADAAQVSESHLCRILKKEAGDSFVNILNRVRIKKAQKLLHEGNLKVYEIAEVVGFSNYAYFYQVFKKITGYSPKESH